MTNSDNDEILKDIGRKCSDDVAAAVRRNIHLMGDRRGKMIVATYGAAAAIGAANGAFAAFMDGPDEIDAVFVDKIWAEILRPMILGDLADVAAQVNRMNPLPPPEQGWQAIETAPRVHGTRILAPNRYGVVDIICWNDSFPGWDDGFGYSEDLDPDQRACHPAIWTPVPELPSGEPS